MRILLAIVIICFYLTGCSESRIKLNDKFHLLAHHNNPYKVILVNIDGDVVIADSISTFWGQYPYFWGQAYDKKKKKHYFFLFNLDTGELFTKNIGHIMKSKGLPNLNGYEQISFAEFYSSDSSVDKDRISFFMKQMRLK